MTMTRPPLATVAALVGMMTAAGLTLSSCLPATPKPGQLPDLAAGQVAMPDGGADLGPEATIDAGTQLTARRFFESEVKNSLLNSCGACHAREGGVYPFLKISGPDDPYQTIRNWPGFVLDIAIPSDSKLMSKGRHDGPPLTGTDTGCTDQCAAVARWLEMEIAEIDLTRPVKRSPQTPPFVPKTDGSYTRVELGELRNVDARLFAGAYLSFQATLLPLNRGIEIKDLRFFNVKADATATREQRTIRFVRPLFAVWKVGADPLPDPVDNFASTDRTVRLFGDDDDQGGDARVIPGAGNLIVPGLFTLSAYRAGDALNVSFNRVEVLAPLPGENPCTAAGFAKLKPIRPYLARNQGNNNCGTRVGCHTKEATIASLDLSAALEDPAPGAESAAYKGLCERMKFYNQAGTMGDNTDPMVSRHPIFKYDDATCTNLGLGTGCHAAFKQLIEAMRAADP